MRLMEVLLSLVLFGVYLLLLGLAGWVLVNRVLNGETNLLILLPLSFFVAMGVFLFLLNLALYALPFSWANRLLLPLFCVASLGLSRTNMFRGRGYTWGLDVAESRAFFALLAVVVLLVSLQVSGTFYADNIWHTALAMTLQNGNCHPMRWPWYPDYYYAYHYGFDLLMASTQDFCGINQFYADKPWHIMIVAGMFVFIFGLIRRSLSGNFLAGILASVCFLFFSGFSFIGMGKGAYGILEACASNTFKEAYDAVADFYRRPTFEPISFLDFSLHKPSLIKHPIYFSLAYLVANIHKAGSSRPPALILCGILLGFLALCEVSLFALAGVALGFFFLWKIIGSERQDRTAWLTNAVVILGLGMCIAWLQGGYLTTLWLHANEQYPAGSVLHASGQYDRFRLTKSFHLASRPVFTTNLDIWRDLVQYYALPMACFVALQWRVLRDRAQVPQEFRHIFLIWSFTFWFGFLVAGLVVLPFADQIISRMYVWGIVSLSTGVSLALAWQTVCARPGTFRFRRAIGLALAVLLITATLGRVAAGITLSVAFQFSNAKQEMKKKIAFGQWLRKTLPSDARLFGMEPRYTGLFSYGGHPERDEAMIPEDELEAFKRAQTEVDHAFLRKATVTHLVVKANLMARNGAVLSNANKFVEIDGPFSCDWRVYRVVP